MNTKALLLLWISIIFSTQAQKTPEIYQELQDSVNAYPWKHPKKQVFLKQMTQIAEERKDYNQIIKATLMLVRAEYSVGEGQKAFNTFKILDKYQKHFSPEEQANVYYNHGDLATKTDQYHKAYKSFLAAKELYEKIGNTSKRLKSQQNLARLQLKLGNYKKAIEGYQKIDRTLLDSMTNTRILMDIGISYNNLKQLDSAKYYYKLAETYYSSEKQKGSFYNNYGHFLKRHHQYDQAQSSFEKALKIYTQAGKEVKIAMCYSNIGEIFLLKEKLDLAEEYLLKALKIQTEKKDIRGQMYSHMMLYNIYEYKKQFQKSLDHHVLAYEFKEKIIIAENIKMDSLERIEDRNNFEVQKCNLENKVAEQKILTEAKETEKNIFQWTAILLLFFTIVLAFLIFALRKANKKVSEAKREIEDSNQKLSTEIEKRRISMKSFYDHTTKKIKVSNALGKRPFINISDIVMVEKERGSDNLIRFYTNHSVYSKSSTTASIQKLMEQELNIPDIFYQVNKYTIVHLHHITSINSEKKTLTISFNQYHPKDKKEKPVTKEIKIAPENENTILKTVKEYLELWKAPQNLT